MTPGADFDALPTSVTIPANQNSTTVTLTPTHDGTPEWTDTATLQITALGTSYLLMGGGADHATVEIVDNDLDLVMQDLPEETAPQPNELNPGGFIGVNDWYGRIRELYVATIRTDQALQTGKVDSAKPLLASLRAGFYNLHAASKTLRANDIAYALELELQKSGPQVGQLRRLMSALQTAPLPRDSGMAAQGYQAARAELVAKAGSALADGKLDQDELKTLRAAAGVLYRGIGRQRE